MSNALGAIRAVHEFPAKLLGLPGDPLDLFGDQRREEQRQSQLAAQEAQAKAAKDAAFFEIPKQPVSQSEIQSQQIESLRTRAARTQAAEKRRKTTSLLGD